MSENELTRNPSPAQRLISPYVRVQIGKDIFVLGDGLLKDCKVTLGEGSNLNNCSFSIFDPNKAFADKYFTTIFRSDGLTPLNIPSASGGSGSADQASFQGISSIYGVDPATISRAVQFFIGQGITVKGAAYLVGSALQESRLDPAASDGTAVGLFQWQGGRQSGMPADFDGQLKFAITEMQSDYSNILPTLKDKNASSSDLAAAIQSWERYGVVGNRYQFAETLYQMLTSSDTKDKAQQTVQTPKKELPPAIKESVTGQQITIELGFGGEAIAATSYLHTSLDFDLFDPNKLSFGGQAATWVLTQRKKNTAYTNMTLRQIAQKICNGYGIKLEMEEDGPEYEFFPQRGKNDYETLLSECRRLGYRFHSFGNTLSIKPRSTEKNGFVLVFGENMGTTFKVSHQAQGDSAGGARASAPSSGTTTGERKWSLDPATGETTQDRLENETGTGGNAIATTGSQTIQVAPVEAKPKSKKKKGKNDKDPEAVERVENEARIKGITLSFSMPTTPEALSLDPDTLFLVNGVFSFIDRIFVIESITHEYSSSGFVTSGTAYSPLKNKYPSSVKNGRSGGSTSRNPGGFIDPTESRGPVISKFGQRGGRLHAGIDLAAAQGTDVVAAKEGTISYSESGCVEGNALCGGGWGNHIDLDHGGGELTRYAHLSSLSVSMGDKVEQGQKIGEIGSTGSSSGPHLHLELRRNNEPIDPETEITGLAQI